MRKYFIFYILLDEFLKILNLIFFYLFFKIMLRLFIVIIIYDRNVFVVCIFII